MGLKKKICSALAVSVAISIFSFPAFAETSKNTQKTETKIEQRDSKHDSRKCDKPSKKFEREFNSRFETELKKEKVWHGLLNLRTLDDVYDNDSDYYLEYEKNYKDKVEKAAQKAGIKALERTVRDLEIWEEVVERIKWLTKFEIVKSKNKKLEFKNPITGFKNPSRSGEEKLEDKIYLLRRDIEDQKKANNLQKTDELEKELNKTKDQLYQKRKFKLSFGFDLDHDGYLNHFDAGVYSKLKSRYLDGRFSYSRRNNKFRLELDKELQKNFHVKLENTYQQKERTVDNYLGTQYELDTNLNLYKKLSKNIDVSLNQSYNWDYQENTTNVGLSKVFKNGLSFSLNSGYNWQTDGTSITFGINFNF